MTSWSLNCSSTSSHSGVAGSSGIAGVASQWMNTWIKAWETCHSDRASLLMQSRLALKDPWTRSR